MLEKGTLLLVEDNHDLRNALKEILTHEGFTVLSAAHGKEGLVLLQGQVPDLIISDITMPEMDGYEFYDAVRARPEGILIPFIFLTARGERQDMMLARNLGAEDYLIKPVDRQELVTTVRSRLERNQQLMMLQLQQAYEASLIMLANAIELRDKYTRGHIERVMEYAIAIAEKLGWTDIQLRPLRFGSILHDIGKIYIRESILRKPGPLTPEEWVEMKQHATIGADLLKSISYLSDAIPIIRHHHERWDGKGYPDGLAGEDIPQGARIVSVADCFDAMTTARIYHDAVPKEVAINEIKTESGVRYDPLVVDAFLSLDEWW